MDTEVVDETREAMAIATAASVTSLDGFRATPAPRRAEELGGPCFSAINAAALARTEERQTCE
jgi:hypothetical protein